MDLLKNLKRRLLKKNKKGFSLIELMIVIAIIGILVAVALPQFQGMRDEAKVAKAQQDIDVLIGATVKYNSLEDSKLKDLDNLEGKYLVEVPPTDPWDKPYKLDPNAGTISSAGPDRQFDTGDDVLYSYLPAIVLLSAKYIIKDNNDDKITDVNGEQIDNLNGDKITFTFSKALYLWKISGGFLKPGDKVKNTDIKLEENFDFYDAGVDELTIEADEKVVTFGSESTVEVGVNYITVTLYGDVNTPGEINSNVEPNQYKVNVKQRDPGKAAITDTKSTDGSGACDPAIPSGYKTKIKT